MHKYVITIFTKDANSIKNSFSMTLQEIYIIHSKIYVYTTVKTRTVKIRGGWKVMLFLCMSLFYYVYEY